MSRPYPPRALERCLYVRDPFVTYAVYDRDRFDRPLERFRAGAEAIQFARQGENGRGFVVLRRCEELPFEWNAGAWGELYRSPERS